jgi:hypothetical protein
MRCATHPDVETGLTCGKCGKPICPQCLVQTPVGARCQECARLKKIPTFMLSPLDYVKATFVGLGMAMACGILWHLIRLVTPYILFFNILVAAAFGYGIGQVISLCVNRKRGLFLKVIAGICLLIAFIIGNQVTLSGNFIFAFNLFSLVALGIGVYLAVARL